MKRKTAIKFMMSACYKKWIGTRLRGFLTKAEKLLLIIATTRFCTHFYAHAKCGRGWMASPSNKAVLPLKLLSSFCAKENEGGI